MSNQLSSSVISALVETLTDGVVMFDSQKQVLLANPAATRFTGLPTEGYNLSELFTLFGVISLEKMVNEALLMQTVTHIPEAHVSLFTYDIVVAPVKDDANQLLGGVIILHDITAQKKSERESKERTKEIESLNKFMLGRELRMFELKEEMKKLKQKLLV